MTSIETDTSVIPNADKRRLEFTYDYLGRRVRKIVRNGYDGSSYTTEVSDTKFVYNGWNCIAALDANNSEALVASYFWGMDIAGPGQRAGGIGALLMIKDGSNSYVPAYDGMGNLHALMTTTAVEFDEVEYAAGDIVAAYEYDAFGQTIRESGPYAAANPFRFSTKYADLDTGLVYFGLRYYSPTLGRFINRDPISEFGGLNLYGYCGNDAVNGWDYLGLTDSDLLRRVRRIERPVPLFEPGVPNDLAPGASPLDYIAAIDDPIGRVNGLAALAGHLMDGEAEKAQTRQNKRDLEEILHINTDGMSDQKINDLAYANGLDHRFAGGGPNQPSHNTKPGAADGGGAPGRGASKLGRFFRDHFGLLGGMLGVVADVFSGAVNVTLHLATFGNLGSLRGGLHQIGYGLGQTADILARDAAATMAGVFGKLYVTTRDVLNVATFGQVDSLGNLKPNGTGTKGESGPLGAIGRLLYGALVPCYGNFNGTGWGVPLVGFRSGLIINQSDIAAFRHDQKPNLDWGWIRDQWTTNPQAQWVGPVGAAFALLGTVPFGIRGAFQDKDGG